MENVNKSNGSDDEKNNNNINNDKNNLLYEGDIKNFMKEGYGIENALNMHKKDIFIMIKKIVKAQ